MIPSGQATAVIHRRAGLGRLTIAQTYPVAKFNNLFRKQAVPARIVLVLTAYLYRAGLRASHMQLLSMGSVGLCIVLWIRAKTVDQDERGNAERRALFVGLWPPTIWLIADSLERHE
jgi:hypothetical protein